MSWWGIGDNDVIGDGPADVITVALRSIADERADAGRDRPSLAAFLSALGRALPGDVGRLRGRLDDGRDVHAAPGREAEDVAIVLREAFDEIDRQYAERWGRPPNLRELLHTVLFVLMGGAPDFLAGDGALHDIQETE